MTLRMREGEQHVCFVFCGKMFIPLAVSASKIILRTVQAGKNINRIFCYCFLLPTVFMYLHVALLSV